MSTQSMPKKMEYPSSHLIIAENINGNLHDATTSINERGLGNFLFQLDSVTGSSSIAIYKVHRNTYEHWKQKGWVK